MVEKYTTFSGIHTLKNEKIPKIFTPTNKLHDWTRTDKNYKHLSKFAHQQKRKKKHKKFPKNPSITFHTLPFWRLTYFLSYSSYPVSPTFVDTLAYLSLPCIYKPFLTNNYTITLINGVQLLIFIFYHIYYSIGNRATNY
jgi:hypothetical protein